MQIRTLLTEPAKCNVVRFDDADHLAEGIDDQDWFCRLIATWPRNELAERNRVSGELEVCFCSYSL